MKKPSELESLERSNLLNFDKPFFVKLSTVAFSGYVNNYDRPDLMTLYKRYLDSCRYLLEHPFNTSCSFMWICNQKLFMYFKNAESYCLSTSNSIKVSKLVGINCSILSSHFNRSYINALCPDKIMLWSGFAYNLSYDDVVDYLIMKQKNYVKAEGGRGLQDVFYRRNDCIHGMYAPNFLKDRDLMKHIIE